MTFPAIAKKSDTDKGTVILYENGLMHQVYQDNTDLVMNDSLKELDLYRADFCRDKKRPILVDITNLRSVDKSSRNIYTSKESAALITRAALLVGNPVSRIIGNFYLGINKALFPVKMFTEADEAMNWLSEGLEKDRSV